MIQACIILTTQILQFKRINDACLKSLEGKLKRALMRRLESHSMFKKGGNKEKPQAPAFSYLQARVISLMPQTVNYKNVITAIFGSMAW